MANELVSHIVGISAIVFLPWTPRASAVPGALCLQFSLDDRLALHSHLVTLDGG